MPKTKISEYSATANSNTDVASINIDEGCAPSGINNAIRAVMGHLKDFQQGTNGDPFNGPVNGTVGATTPSTGAFTTLSSTGNSYFATSSGNVGIGTSSTSYKLDVSGTGSIGARITGTASASLILNNASGYFGYLQYNSAGSGGLYFYDVTNSTVRTVIDASGNLGIGTSSPTMTASNRVVIDVNGTSSSVVAQSSGGTTRGYGYVDSTQMIYGSKTAIPLIFQTTETNRMWLDTSGNLGIGRTPTAAGTYKMLELDGAAGGYMRLYAAGTLSGYFYSSATESGIGSVTSAPFVFYTANTERARFDSNGIFVQKGATTAAGIKPTAIANNESITTVNSTTYTINLGTSAKLFWIALGNGDGALVFTSYISSSITFLGITPSNVVASASPSSAQLGISKSANSHDIVIKTGSALSSTAASWQMGVLSSQVA